MNRRKRQTSALQKKSTPKTLSIFFRGSVNEDECTGFVTNFNRDNKKNGVELSLSIVEGSVATFNIEANGDAAPNTQTRKAIGLSTLNHMPKGRVSSIDFDSTIALQMQS